MNIVEIPITGPSPCGEFFRFELVISKEELKMLESSGHIDKSGSNFRHLRFDMWNKNGESGNVEHIHVVG